MCFLLFQSTHPRRVRPSCHVVGESGALFQSTHSRRVRQALGIDYSSQLKFQSTHSRRVRQQTNNNTFFITVSIHALTKSATVYFDNARTTASMFQSTHSRRVRLQRKDMCNKQILNRHFSVNLNRHQKFKPPG